MGKGETLSDRLDRAEALNRELAEVLKDYERWEASLILSNEAWQNSLPTFTQELYDRWMVLQNRRNEALARLEGGS